MLTHIGFMMVNGNEIIAGLIDATVEEINDDLPPLHRAAKSPGLIILGVGSPYDSLHLINFFVALDDRLHAEFGRSMDFLEDPEILDRAESMLTAEDLAGYIAAKLG